MADRYDRDLEDEGIRDAARELSEREEAVKAARAQPGRRRATAKAATTTDRRQGVARRLPNSNISPETLRRVSVIAWIGAWVVGTPLSATVLFETGVSAGWARVGAGLLCIVFVVGLAYRCGGNIRLWSAITIGLVVLTWGIETQGLVAAATLLTAVSGAVFAVMVTRPAATAKKALREALLTFAIAVNVMVGVAAWNASIQPRLFAPIVIILSLAVVMALVWSLGANLHGLQRREIIILVGIAVGVTAVIAYAAFVRAYGSEGFINAIDGAVTWVWRMFGGVPRPTIVLFGFPTLVLGVALRSLRREGWWATAFAVIGTATIAAALVDPAAFPRYITSSVVYSAIFGIGLGMVLRPIVMKGGVTRASRAFEKRERHEPPRTKPLK